eukprot:COSAG01_NODE_40640_length_461_cov_0.983425_1_plen_94_part_01
MPRSGAQLSWPRWTVPTATAVTCTVGGVIVVGGSVRPFFELFRGRLKECSDGALTTTATAQAPAPSSALGIGVGPTALTSVRWAAAVPPSVSCC